MYKSQTAIIIFALNTRDELPRKNFFRANKAHAARLITELNQQIRQTVKSTGLPYFVIDAQKQTGSSFVSRYKNAFKTAFNQGFKQVIAVGNDSPELTKKTILTIAGCLDSGYNLVYGGTSQGGIYTLGLSQCGFNTFQFEKMSWQTNQLLGEFDALCKIHSDTFSLNGKLTELNSNHDLNQFIFCVSQQGKLKFLFQHLFKNIVAPQINFQRAISWRGTSPHFAKEKLRGPPAFQFI